jgi:hypothetical protein
MGNRMRGLDIGINARRQVADSAASAEAKAVINRWNEQLAAAAIHGVVARTVQELLGGLKSAIRGTGAITHHRVRQDKLAKNRR